MIRRILSVFLFSLLALFSPYVWKKATGEFRLGKLAFNLPYNQNFNVDGVQEGEFFKGPFTYLAHGAQSFVFASEDGEWTLKLFRYDRWIHPWRKFIRNKILGMKERLPLDEKIERLFASTKLAFEKAPDLTGLAYIHLNPEKKLPTVLLKDKLGREYLLDLTNTYFVIQHRARPLPEVFLEAIREEDLEKFKRLTLSFTNLLKTRASRGIRNTDTKVYVNFGFWKENAIEWDFGNYCLDPEMNVEQEISRFIFKPERYMVEFPEWVKEFRREACR